MDALIQTLEDGGRAAPDFSVPAIVLALLMAFVLGQAVAWLYGITHAGLSYSRSFMESLVLMALVVTLVMLVIGNSIVTAFGLLGAMAIIRFRNVLKDTRDTVFVFFTLVMGMAVGSQRHMTAIVATSAFAVVVLYLHVTSFGSQGRFDGHLCLQVPDSTRQDLARLLERHCRTARPVSVRVGGASAELMYQVRLRDRRRGHEMIRAIEALPGVSGLSLVLRDELAEL